MGYKHWFTLNFIILYLTLICYVAHDLRILNLGSYWKATLLPLGMNVLEFNIPKQVSLLQYVANQL